MNRTRIPFAPMAAFAAMATLFPARTLADPFLDRETVTTSFPFPSTTGMDMASGIVNCPEGAVVITGGAWILAGTGGVPPHIALMGSRPYVNGWLATGREMVNNEVSTPGTSLMVSAVCGYTARSTSRHIEVVTRNYTLNRGGGGLDAVAGTAECPAGKTVLSGGARIATSGGAHPDHVMLLVSKFVGNGWYAAAREYAEAPASSAVLSVSAVCADGQSGISQLQTVSATVDMTNSNGTDLGYVGVNCPAGKTGIGGGAEVAASNGALPTYTSLIQTEPYSNGWSALARETQNTPVAAQPLRVTATASCAVLSPDVLNLQVVSRTLPLPNRSGVLDAGTQYVYCPVGKTMIGGGAKVLLYNGTIPAYKTLMASAPSGNGWMGVAREVQEETGATPVNLIVSAICAELPE